MIMGKLLLKSWGTWMQICLEGADVRGIKPSFVRDKTRLHSPTKEEEIVMKKSDTHNFTFHILKQKIINFLIIIFILLLSPD